MSAGWHLQLSPPIAPNVRNSEDGIFIRRRGCKTPFLGQGFTRFKFSLFGSVSSWFEWDRAKLVSDYDYRLRWQYEHVILADYARHADNKITSYQCMFRYTDLVVCVRHDFRPRFRPLRRLVSVWDFMGTSFACSIGISDHLIVPL